MLESVSTQVASCWWHHERHWSCSITHKDGPYFHTFKCQPLTGRVWCIVLSGTVNEHVYSPQKADTE